MPQIWTAFHRRDLSAVIAAVHTVAGSGDPGAHGHGVELVVESPPLRWWARRFRHRTREQARIAVTKSDGRTCYPVHVRLVTGHGADAAKRVDRRAGWVVSNSNGEAILMMKAQAATDTAGVVDATELVTGTVEALTELHLRTPNRGWRYTVEREVLRD